LSAPEGSKPGSSSEESADDGGSRLVAVADRAKATREWRVVANAKLIGAEAKSIRFFINGQPADQVGRSASGEEKISTNGTESTCRIEPALWGRGVHRVTAVAETVGGKSIGSSNAVTVNIGD
jgi:hypothetical protein